MTTPTPAREITAICAACHRPINDGGGLLHVTRASLQRGTEQGVWQVHHHKHRFGGDTDDVYGIEVERIRTWRDVVWWTAHLSAKHGFARTDWDEVLAGLLDGQPPDRLVAAR